MPTTLLICSTIGAAYGYYVWLEIQPPKQQLIAQRIAPPPPPPAPVATPLVPLMPEVATVTQPAPTHVATTKEAAAKKSTPKTTVFGSVAPSIRNARPSPENNNAVHFEHQQELSNIDQLLASAYESYQSGDSTTAWQRYREVTSKEPNNRDALLGLAVIAQQQGHDEESQHYYRRALQLDPRDPVANAGLAAFATGNKAETESRLKQLISEQPNSASLYFALGNHYAEQSRWSDAQQAYFSACNAEPRNAQFAFNLAISLDHLGQTKAAIKYYELALKLDTSGNSGFDRGQTQQRLNGLSSSSH